jgi:hypothetical protein
MPNSIDTGRLVDIGYGRPIELSSRWGTSENMRQLLPSVHGFHEDYAFHTNVEVNPYVIVDLESPRLIKRIRIYNREAHPRRALPLLISASEDKGAWHDVAMINFVFGGRKSGEPLELLFAHRLRARYLKLEVRAEVYFHLDYIEICEELPELDQGRLIRIDTTGPRIKADYAHHNSYGFSWTFTLSILAISKCRENNIVVTGLDYSSCLAPFKDHPGKDLYPVLFERQPYSPRYETLSPIWFMHHGVYATFDLKTLHEYAELYFKPSAGVLKVQDDFVLKYGIRPASAIALVFRGTDKESEVKAAPIGRYIEIAQAALRHQPDLQVIIQTDQMQALEAVLAAIPQAIHISELPVTSGATVIHHLPLEEEYRISKTAFAVRMLAAIYLLSRCRFVVSHTGNIGLWLACYRGHSSGFFQFDSETALRAPDSSVIGNPFETEALLAS